ncbi:secretion protein HlyD [Alcanivorax xiamenensis]|uniref:Secretion protein HlyD n=1 Tax=Alcanivorax xiamenensis TaxID=1177156 RepID=A0ABQ6Y4R5_9GAMM|nr:MULTISPECIES: HlyD family secretion protein [Alcanivorax]KAF0803754.1 secretion protein HlyD [Alcanivorax xiamenensis]
MTDSSSRSRPPLRPSRQLKLAALVALVVACLIWMALAIHHRLTHVSAQDARVMSSQVTVSSRLPGWVPEFTLTEGDRLQKGDVVARLYSEPDQQKLKTLQADVAAMQARLDYEQARLSLGQQQFEGGLHITSQELQSARAAEKAARARLTQARKDFERSDALHQRGAVSQQQRDQDYYTYQAAQAEYQRSREEVAVSQAQADNAHVGFLNGVQVPLPPPTVMKAQVRIARQQLEEARARLAQQELRLRDLTVRSPINGVVNKTLIDQGEYVAPGQPILMMHDPDDLWVAANIKETDVAELRLGQPVNITVDAYPDESFNGSVQVIGRAATSQFALLPDPNPSGNFTKITQRLPVRIRLEDGPLDLIGPGMMVEVDIDVSGG